MMRVLITALLMAMALPGAALAADSLVPPGSRIDDYQARRQLGLVYVYGHDYAKARPVFMALEREHPDDWALLADMAELELALGHARRCADLYARALALAPADEAPALELRLAQAMNMWGDFYRMEEIYRRRLAADPGDTAVRFKLARLLVSAQRYNDALWEYQSLLADGAPPKDVFPALCELQWQAKDLDACLERVEATLALLPEDPTALGLGGKVLMRRGDFAGAAAYYARLAATGQGGAGALVGWGRALEKQGQGQQARRLYEQALAQNPADPLAAYWLMGRHRAVAPEHLDALLAPGALDAPGLAAWAGVFAEDGQYQTAARCYEAALAADPAYFPARLGLAEALGIGQQYDRANALLAELARDFPGDSKVLITQARVLAWSKKYDEAIARYQGLAAQNPADPLPVREAARTAAWGKDMARAGELYQKLQEPPVDKTLARDLGRGEVKAAIDEASWKGRAPELARSLGRAASGAGDTAGYAAYESLERAMGSGEAALPPARREALNLVIERNGPRYRVQKEAALEGRAKRELWDRRFLRAMGSYVELTDFQPGNQEAWFDLAQSQCALGLCRRQQSSYRTLLTLDPMHSRAAEALGRLERLANPRLGLAYGRWHENGYGERAQITTHRADAALEVPLGRFKLEAAGYAWWELPTRWAGEYQAQGFGLGASGPLTPWLRGSLNWTHKAYDQDDPGDLDGGQAQAWANLRDWAQVGLGWSRQDVVKNAFSIRQGIMADTWWLALRSRPVRELEAALDVRLLEYSDDNGGQWESLRLDYDLTDHPRRFTIGLLMEHRDNRHETVEIYNGDQLSDMIHPYWAPQDWWGGTVSFKWRHDLATQEYCGARQHYYQLIFSLSDDSDHNQGWGLEGLWHLDLGEHWDAEARGLWHRSTQWDASGLWLNLGYRF